MKRKIKTFAPFIVCLAIVLSVSGYTSAAQEVQDSVAMAPDTLNTQPAASQNQLSNTQSAAQNIDTFWELTTTGGNIAYIILGVLILGIIVITFKLWEIGQDWYRSLDLKGIKFNELMLTEIETEVEQARPSHLKGMMSHIIEVYRAGGEATGIQQELVTFVDLKYEGFESYRSWIHFLSDSAGGLGLLGTVWGIFQTFYGGTLDPDKILNGMGVALITTLFGVIVSLILNFGGTQTFSLFAKRMETVSAKGDALRIYLLELTIKSQPLQLDSETGTESRIPAGNTVRTYGSDNPDFLEKLFSRLEHAVAGKHSAESASSDSSDSKQEDVKISIQLKEPVPEILCTGEMSRKVLKLQLEDKAGRSLAHKNIKLETGGQAFFAGKKRELRVETDKSGHLEIDLLGGERVGTGSVRYWLEGEKEHAKTIHLEVKASTASRLRINRGNNQPGRINQRLPQPLQVVAEDQFGNPVPNAEVQFKLAQGNGYLNGGNLEYAGITNSDGTSEVEMTVGEIPGFLVVQAHLKNSRNESVEFNILGTN